MNLGRRLHIVLLAAFLWEVGVTSCMAGDRFWESRFGRFIHKVDDYLDRSQEKGVDTTYIRAFERDRFIYGAGFAYRQCHDMRFPVTLPNAYTEYAPNGVNFDTDLSTLKAELELGIDYKCVSIEIPIAFRNHYFRSFGLAKNGNVWGFRTRYKRVERLHGKVDFSDFNQVAEQLKEDMGYSPSFQGVFQTTTEEEIPSNLNDLKTFFVEGYYVFNHKKFSLAAAAYGDMKQMKSAGSFFAMANYYQSRYGCHEQFLYDHDYFYSRKLSAGVGYGYNVSLLNGRLCLHASVIPMFTVYNKVLHRGVNDDGSPLIKDGYDEKQIEFAENFYNSVERGHQRFVLNDFGRLAASYSYKRLMLSLLINHRRYVYRSTTGFRIGNGEMDARLKVGWRF